MDPETRKGDFLILRIENVQDADPKMNAACRFNFTNTEKDTAYMILPGMVR